MKKNLSQYYRAEKRRVLEKCVECGVCAKKCPIIKTTELADVSPPEIQRQIKAYLKTGETNQTVFNRAFSCMQCFQCVDKCCPEGLDPMAVNEIIKWQYRQNKIVEMGYGDSKDADATHRVLAGIQLAVEDYRKITTPSVKNSATHVFFSGCNVYYQPEKLLNALDIMDLITDDYTFVPGLDYCCGSGAEAFFPNSFETVRDDRLAEASQTGAEMLVDVCHHCHNVFCCHESEYGFEVKNYVSLVAEALGIEREDKFKKYKQWGDLDKITDDAQDYIEASPLSIEKIRNVLNEIL